MWKLRYSTNLKTKNLSEEVLSYTWGNQEGFAGIGKVNSAWKNTEDFRR